MSSSERDLAARIHEELETRTVVTIPWGDLSPILDGDSAPQWHLVKLHRFAGSHGLRCRVAPNQESADFCRKPPGRDLGWAWPQNTDGASGA